MKLHILLLLTFIETGISVGCTYAPPREGFRYPASSKVALVILDNNPGTVAQGNAPSGSSIFSKGLTRRGFSVRVVPAELFASPTLPKTLPPELNDVVLVYFASLANQPTKQPDTLSTLALVGPALPAALVLPFEGMSGAIPRSHLVASVKVFQVPSGRLLLHESMIDVIYSDRTGLADRSNVLITRLLNGGPRAGDSKGEWYFD